MALCGEPRSSTPTCGRQGNRAQAASAAAVPAFELGREEVPDQARLEAVWRALREERDGERERAALFLRLPCRETYPDYYTLVAQPIALSTIAERIRRGAYRVLQVSPPRCRAPTRTRLARCPLTPPLSIPLSVLLPRQCACGMSTREGTEGHTGRAQEAIPLVARLLQLAAIGAIARGMRKQ